MVPGISTLCRPLQLKPATPLRWSLRHYNVSCTKLDSRTPATPHRLCRLSTSRRATPGRRTSSWRTSESRFLCARVTRFCTTEAHRRDDGPPKLVGPKPPGQLARPHAPALPGCPPLPRCGTWQPRLLPRLSSPCGFASFGARRGCWVQGK